MVIFAFIRDAILEATSGGKRYHWWMAALTFGILCGLFGWYLQLRHGLVVTGMNDHISWGLYISNFTFLVGVAAAAVMLVMPTYVLHDVDFSKAVLIGEGTAVAALIMCLGFITVDMGSPQNLWHMIPVIGIVRFPDSLLAWDALVLNGYLALNALIPFYILYSHWRGRKPNPKVYVPFVILSVFWAVGIHMVTAFLYAGLPARPFWNSSLLGPRFLASAFAAGPAFMILALAFIRSHTAYAIRDVTLNKLALITTVAAQINLVMLVSELFKEFYWPTHHSISAQYVFFGLHGHDSLVPWIWTAIGLNITVTLCLTIHPIRRNLRLLYPLCFLLFLAVWIEKGMGLIVPGFIPSPLGEIVEYRPSPVELVVTLGIWCLGLFIFTILSKVAIAVELGTLRQTPAAPAAAAASPAPETVS